MAHNPALDLPTSVTVGRDGRVAHRQAGAATTAQLEAMITPLLHCLLRAAPGPGSSQAGRCEPWCPFRRSALESGRRDV